MEVNKYYTPEIEEFYIGLKYEIKGYSSKDEWSSFTLDKYDMTTVDCGSPEDHCFATNQWDYILEEIEKGNVRVKLLDREDIESLGFLPINSENKPDEVTWWVRDMYKESHQLTYNETDNIYTISFGMHEFCKVLFQGEIKNKSELKKLMKMLKIE